MKTNCVACGGKVTQQTISYTQWYKGQLLLIENVPAWVCDKCGETYFDPDIVEQIQNLIWSGAPPSRLVETPVYDLRTASPS